jgi:hypothetical protein
MVEPKPKPEPAVPKQEGGVKSTDKPAPDSTGMLHEGGETPHDEAPERERPGGMIGEG